jgi:hypothetical protein
MTSCLHVSTASITRHARPYLRRWLLQLPAPPRHSNMAVMTCNPQQVITQATYLVTTSQGVLVHSLGAAGILPVEQGDRPEQGAHPQGGGTHDRRGDGQVDDAACEIRIRKQQRVGYKGWVRGETATSWTIPGLDLRLAPAYQPPRHPCNVCFPPPHPTPPRW